MLPLLVAFALAQDPSPPPIDHEWWPLAQIDRINVVPGGVLFGGVEVTAGPSDEETLLVAGYGITDTVELFLRYGLDRLPDPGRGTAEIAWEPIQGDVAELRLGLRGGADLRSETPMAGLSITFWSYLTAKTGVWVYVDAPWEEGAAWADLGLGFAWQPADPLYLELDLWPASFGIKDSDTYLPVRDMFPIELYAYWSTSNAFDLGVGGGVDPLDPSYTFAWAGLRGYRQLRR
jgi:hypothetical protein